MKALDGIAETPWRLDGWLAKFDEGSGTRLPAPATLVAISDRIEELCGGTLQKERRDADVLDIIRLHNEALVLMRRLVFLEVLEKRRGRQ